MPAALADKILKLHQKPEPELIAQNLDALVECVYAFQTEFVNTFIVQKEYDKYLKFANMGPRPKLVIAPYFMIKSEDSYSEKQMWLHYNSESLLQGQVFLPLQNCQFKAELLIEWQKFRKWIF